MIYSKNTPFWSENIDMKFKVGHDDNLKHLSDMLKDHRVSFLSGQLVDSGDTLFTWNYQVWKVVSYNVNKLKQLVDVLKHHNIGKVRCESECFEDFGERPLTWNIES